MIPDFARLPINTESSREVDLFVVEEYIYYATR